jgi:hypothetical protein
MASYFDEHDCQPLGQGEAPDHLMHFARLLIDTGAWNQVNAVDTFYAAQRYQIECLRTLPDF